MKRTEIERRDELQIVLDMDDDAALATHVRRRSAARTLRSAVVMVAVVLILVAASTFANYFDVAGAPRGGCLAHNQVSVGSTPTPATTLPNRPEAIDSTSLLHAEAGATARKGSGFAPRAHRAPVFLVALANSTADEKGIPRGLLAAVIHTESRWEVNALGKAGEVGLMQLMPRTAAALGVDPHNIVENLRGGATYLRRHYEQTGDWSRALARYNGRGPKARAYAQRVLRTWEASE